MSFIEFIPNYENLGENFSIQDDKSDNNALEKESNEYLGFPTPSKELTIILICSGAALLLLIILMTTIICICWHVRRKRKNKEKEIPVSSDLDNALMDNSIDIDDQEMLKKGKITKNTAVMSTIVKGTKLSSPVFIKKLSNKNTDCSRASQYSINSTSNEGGQNSSKLRGRKTYYKPSEFSSKDQDEKKNKSDDEIK
jgi:hypothetical protein